MEYFVFGGCGMKYNYKLLWLGEREQDNKWMLFWHPISWKVSPLYTNQISSSRFLILHASSLLQETGHSKGCLLCKRVPTTTLRGLIHNKKFPDFKIPFSINGPVSSVNSQNVPVFTWWKCCCEGCSGLHNSKRSLTDFEKHSAILKASSSHLQDVTQFCLEDILNYPTEVQWDKQHFSEGFYIQT